MNQIGQIAIAVSDTDRSEAFYEQTLGLRKLYRFGDLSFFDCAGVRLMLSPPENDAKVEPGQGAIQVSAMEAVLDRRVSHTMSLAPASLPSMIR